MFNSKITILCLVIGLFYTSYSYGSGNSTLSFSEDFQSEINYQAKRLDSNNIAFLTQLNKQPQTEKYAFGSYYQLHLDDEKYGDIIGCIANSEQPNIILVCEEDFSKISYLKLQVIIGNEYSNIFWSDEDRGLENTLEVMIYSPEQIQQFDVTNSRVLTILDTIDRKHSTFTFCLTYRSTKELACYDFPYQSVDGFDIKLSDDKKVIEVEGECENYSYKIYYHLVRQQYKIVSHSNADESLHCFQLASFTNQDNAQALYDRIYPFHFNVSIFPKELDDQKYYVVALISDSKLELDEIRVDLEDLIGNVGYSLNCSGLQQESLFKFNHL